MSRPIPKPWSAADAGQLIIAIDRSFVEVNVDADGAVVEKLTTGAASKVALASYSAAVAQGKAGAYVCAAKTDYERKLANQRDSQGQRVPYKAKYDGKEVNIYFCDIPKDIYETARDEFFSAHMWFWLQRQRHPKIRRPFEKKMFEAHRLANRYMAEVVDEIAQSNAIVDSHDTHVAMLGRELNLRGRSDLFKRIILHTAFPPDHFVEDEITERHDARNPPDAMSEAELVEWMNAIAENDIVSTSGSEWSRNFHNAHKLLRRRNPRTCRPIDALKLVTAPVPVDVQQLRSEFLQSTKSEDGRPSKHRLVLDQIEYRNPSDEEGAPPRRRRVVTVAGRDEPYKNIDKFILAMEKLLATPGHEDVICPLLISGTRMDIKAYAEKFAFDKALADAANKRLGRNAFVVVDGTDRGTVVAWMHETDVNVTLARDDGFNWMAVEPTATHMPGPDENVSERTRALYRFSRALWA